MRKLWFLGFAFLMIFALMAITAGCGGDNDNTTCNNSQQSGILVSGDGKVSVAPDMATLSLGIETQKDTVAEAQTQAASAMDGVMTALKENGVVGNDIQTSQFSITPVTKWDEDKQQQITLGYQVTNTVEAKVRELGKIGQIIDAVAVAGGDFARVQGISFSVEDPKPYQAKAREKALADAKSKADQMASLTGVTLGKPIYISESGYLPGPIRLDASAVPAETAAGSTTPISTGEQEISISVQITYEIK
jgi:uncharacterized protein